MTCNWTVRSGTKNTFWAFTPCKKGFNYLSKAKSADEIIPAYDGRLCPICGGIIKCNVELVTKSEE